MTFQLLAPRIVFGPGSASRLPELAREFGTKPLIVTGSEPSRFERILGELAKTGLTYSAFACVGEPTASDVRDGAAKAREATSDMVIGIGGGSAIDAGKAIAALASNSGEPLEYMENVGEGKPLANAPLPFIAVPTTAGTGAEASQNAVIDSPEHQAKASIRSRLMLARVAIVDPELTYSVPPAVTATTGLDTLTQLIEPYVSCRANDLTDALCLAGLRRARTSLEAAFRDGNDGAAREGMSFASMLSGLALANAGLGVVHGFAAPLGGMTNAAHGALCAAVLPQGMLGNIEALRERAPDHPALGRYGDLARLLTGKADAVAEDGAEWVFELSKRLGIQGLGSYGLQRGQIPDLVKKASSASSMKANPLPLTEQELTRIAEWAL